MTLKELTDRALTALRSHEARTAIDLSEFDSLRIVVCLADYNDVCREARKLMETESWGYAQFSMDRSLRLGGVLVVPDHDLRVEDVRLRTEVVA